MQIYLDNSYAVVHAPIEVRRELTALLAAKPTGYMHIPSYKAGRWDGFIRMFDKKLNRFPIGLLDLVLTKYPEFEIIDNRPTIAHRTIVTTIGDRQLRPYQIAAVQALLDSNMLGTLGMATNAGKTLVAASLYATLGFPSMLYVLPSVALLHQTYKDFTEYFPGRKFGRVGAGYKDLQPATFITMASLDAIKLNSDLLIVDECHQGKSDKRFERLMGANVRGRVGMSGTPLTYDKLSDMMLAGVTGPIVYTITNAELIESGHSTPPVIKFKKIDNVYDDNLKYIDAYRTMIVQNGMRNQYVVEWAQAGVEDDKAIMIMCNWIEHAKLIAKNFTCPHIYLDGSSSEEELAAGLTQFKTQGGILLCTPIFSAGINVPNMDILILAAGGKSHIQLLQRVGRGLRVSKGKQYLYVYDFIDAGNKFLFKHSQTRLEIYREQGFKVELV